MILEMKPVKPLNQPTRSLRLPTDILEIAYLAGLFDGEGTVVRRYKKGYDHEYGGISIANTDRGLIKWLGSLGGGITHGNRPTREHKVCYVWYVNREVETLEFLEAVLPFLRVKHKQAKRKLEVLYTQRMARVDLVSDRSIRDDEIMRLWATGNFTYRAVSRIVGCHHNTVKSAVNRAS